LTYNDHGETKPPEAVAGKPSLRYHRRKNETCDAEAQSRNVRCIQAGCYGEARQHTPASPDRYRSEPERGSFQIFGVGWPHQLSLS